MANHCKHHDFLAFWVVETSTNQEDEHQPLIALILSVQVKQTKYDKHLIPPPPPPPPSLIIGKAFDALINFISPVINPPNVVHLKSTNISYRCPNKSSDPIECVSGSYAPAHSLECLQCPKGSHCPSNGLSTHVPCGNGTYTDAKGTETCSLCPAGSKCPHSASAPIECENGTYSKGGTTYCTECPAGHRLV